MSNENPNPQPYDEVEAESVAESTRGNPTGVRWLRLLFFLIVSWFVMVTTHEIGHVFGGVSSGAVLQQVELRPWKLPHSYFDPDPKPLITLWCGPIFGVLVPWLLASLLRLHWSRFVASFSMLANGIYLAVAWMTGDHLLDTPRLLAAGASPASIIAFCIVTIGFGYPQFRQACLNCLSPKTAVF